MTGSVQNKHFSIQETNFPPAEALILKDYGASHKNDRPVEFLPMVPKPLTPQTVRAKDLIRTGQVMETDSFATFAERPSLT